MRRRGRKPGLVGVARSLLLVIYHVLHDATEYRDLCRDFLDRIRGAHLLRYHLKQLPQLGFTVTITPVAARIILTAQIAELGLALWTQRCLGVQCG